MAADESQEQKGGHSGSTVRRQNGPFCYSDGHLSSQEFGVGTTNSKSKGRVVLRGDIVKDESGSYAVFAEQGSST